ncbi:hypothetical protein CSA37_08425 [Candidatus Fermentibacteria bacterium]|nr:MAG: hypothetical protein CSA37_08425 [Candidatus Fermentibacteria bacterium]
MILLFLACLGVTISPGWSDPLLVTDSANTLRREQLIHRDELGRFHLVWSDYNNNSRIGYKIFAIDGTVLYPETMLSLDIHSSLHSMCVTGDSLIVFWRNYNPVYYAIRSIADGSEITPATYLFSTSTMYPYIRASADSLGRLHVLYNSGSDVIYAVWNPAPGSGFITEYEWVIEGADSGGVLLVDGNRVHIVVQDPVDHAFSYLQYDIEGNTVVPLTDFTSGEFYTSRFPVLRVDSSGDLMVLDNSIAYKAVKAIYLWKLDGETGDLLLDLIPLVTPDLPDMDTSGDFIVEPLPVQDQFYLCWRGYGLNKIFNLVFDSDGNIIADWYTAYDYSDENPEDIQNIDGVSDDQGNLYVVYGQVETEPEVDYFPTFGWFDYSYSGTLVREAQVDPFRSFTFSCNPVTGSVTVYTNSESQTLRVFDISGREVSQICVSEGSGVWHGTSFAGERLPSGLYNVVEETGSVKRITLLSE